MQSDTFFNSTGGTKKISLVLKDNCTVKPDTVSKNITVVESPIANFNYGVACSRTLTDFKFTGYKPKTTITFNWNFDNQGSSAIENPSYLFSTSGAKNVTLTLSGSNGCKSDISKQVIVKSQSKADFVVKDICSNDSAVFTNTSVDATSYNWKFGDGKNSSLKAPKHKYQITSATQFNVILVAAVKDGCSDSITKTITVKAAPTADFSSEIACSRTHSHFTFTGTKPNTPITTNLNWNFNGESNSKLENDSVLFNQAGSKNITLSLTSSNGCKDSLTKTIIIKPQSNADFTTIDICGKTILQFLPINLLMLQHTTGNLEMEIIAIKKLQNINIK